MKKENPKVKTTDVAREMGQMWRNLQDKGKYLELAAEDRKRYWQQKEAGKSAAASPTPEAVASPPVAVASPTPEAVASPPVAVHSPAAPEVEVSPAPVVEVSPAPVVEVSPAPIAVFSAAVADLGPTNGIAVSESEISPELSLLVADGSPIYSALVGSPVHFS
ncbi:MAG: uncharacterized protein KVP18_000365 [Porospora cf. gigantea A]|nr:MAG: hypothetical protein KVP18_000365 [Porospora cf. gigantea A]